MGPLCWYDSCTILRTGLFGRQITKRWVIEMSSTERRSGVRTNVSFRVKFNVITRKDYERIRRSGDEVLSKGNKRFPVDTTSGDERNNVAILNASLIDFLVRIEEKLDRVLAALSEDLPHGKVLFDQATGESISGSGMTMRGDNPIELGQIIQAEVMLSKFPITVLDLFGEVIWVSPVQVDDSEMYRVGIEFIDLDPYDREKIITCVFEKQREANRKRKSGAGECKDN
jgi:hypothetical protein